MSRSTATDPAAWPGLRPIPLPPLAPNPLVSVLVANYNYARYLPDCLNSVLQQSYGNFEVIVCDDGSKDESLQVLEGFAQAEPRIRILRQENAGQGAALNRAFQSSTGQIVSILDADDILSPNKISETVSSFSAAPTSGLSVHRVSIIDSEGVIAKRPPIPSQLDRGWIAGSVIQRGLSCFIPPASGLSFRREVAEILFPIPTVFTQIADGFLARAAVFVTEVVAVDRVLANYRIHNANLTGIHTCTIPGLNKSQMLYEMLCFEFCKWAELRLGVQLQAEVILRSNAAYLETSLALHILTTAKGKRNPELLDAVIRGYSSTGRKMTWKAIYSLRPELASWAITHWWGPSPLKALVHRFMLLFRNALPNATALQ